MSIGDKFKDDNLLKGSFEVWQGYQPSILVNTTTSTKTPLVTFWNGLHQKLIKYLNFIFEI